MPSGVDDDEELFPSWVFHVDTTQTPESPQRRNTLRFTDELTVRRIYELGRTLSRVLEEEGLFYWTSGGTTLGLVRHKGLIPWDDDLDLCVRDEDEEKLLALEKKLGDNDLVLYDVPTFGYRVFHVFNSVPISEESNVKYLDYRYPFCDIFIMKKKKNKYILREATARVLWPNEWYPKSSIESCRLLPFGDFLLNCPGTPEDYLNRSYGKSWASVGATQNYCHIQRENRQPVEFDLNESKKLYEPAYPFR